MTPANMIGFGYHQSTGTMPSTNVERAKLLNALREKGWPSVIDDTFLALGPHMCNFMGAKVEEWIQHLSKHGLHKVVKMLKELP